MGIAIRCRSLPSNAGGLVNPHAADNVHLLDDICFIPFRRQQHEVGPMLQEIARQGGRVRTPTPVAAGIGAVQHHKPR